jgi:hypothetical protein
MVIVLCWWGIATVSADAPTVIPYQGRLTDTSGQAVDATLPMTFALYATPTGGPPAWVEAHPAITVTDGLFTAYLGDVVPLSSAVLNDNPYLGLTVASDSEMTPRQRLGSVPYARTLAPGAAISGTLGPLLSITNTLDASQPGNGTALALQGTAGSGPVLSIRLDPSTAPPAAFASAIYARREAGIGAWPTIQTTNYDGYPGLAANSTGGTALVGVAGDPGTGGSPAGGPFSPGFGALLIDTKAGVLGYSSIGPGGYFTSTDTGLYATSLDGPAIGAHLGVSGMGSHGFNYTIVGTNSSVQGFSAIIGANGGSGPGVHGRSESGAGVLGEAGRYNCNPGDCGPIDDPLKTLSVNTGAGVMGYSTVGPGVFAWSTITHSLVVSGNARITGDLLIGGDVITNADVAEHYVPVGVLEAGDVVVLDPTTILGVRRAERPYDTSVAGIISTDPAIVLPGAVDGVPLALVGRVPVKADASLGAIQVGDLLTTSSTPGHAMRCVDRLQCVGAIVGKALEPLDGGTGTILVLVTLQ